MLAVTEMNGFRVLTTNQLSEAYSIDPKIITNNFQRNKNRFQQGEHYFVLKGEELKQFKGSHQNDATLKYASVLYLWTEQGAFLLAKSLNSDKAWTAYTLLTSQYYKLSQQPTNAMQALPYDPERFLALEHRVKEIEAQLQLVTIHSGEQKRLQRAISERVYELCDVKARRPAYFSELYRAIKKRYHVDSYRDVPQCQLQDTLLFVQNWGGIQTT
ncbi:MAG: ORF6N domain-containing protein [Niallia sp.]